MAHKLLPLFTLIRATEIAGSLEWLEGQRGNTYSAVIKQKAERVLSLLPKVLEAARKLS